MSNDANIQPRLVWEIEALLGEGPAWFADEAALRLVDIKRGKLHRFDPVSGARETLDLGDQPSFVLPSADGDLVAGVGNRLRRVSKAGYGETLAIIDMPAHNRTNDATVDNSGRLWFGTIDDEEQQPTGALFCLQRGQLHRLGGEAVVTNGPAVSRDGRTLYHVDSGARTIWRFTIGDGPRIADREVFLQLSEADGYPDGVVLDSEDCLWVALWDGWGVRRYAPDGTLLLHIPFPCARVTKVAFGGADLKTAFVTTARIGLNEADLAGQKLAGSVFAFDAPAPGRVLPAVQLS